MLRSRRIRVNTRFFSSQSNAKPNILIVGSGWAGYRLALDLDTRKFNVNIVSPRNHFVFTPLLPSTAVGTLEFRAIQEPIRTIPNIHYYQANVTKINYHQNTVECTDAYQEGHSFQLSYDAIVLAPGSETNTFGVKGVIGNDKVFFLKQLNHSRAIRNRIIECFERASSPAATEKEINQLLTFVVVGGGPTSVEFSAELHDFLRSDLSRWYPDLKDRSKIKIVEATGHILGSFNENLVDYVERLFDSRGGIQLLTGTTVKEVIGNKAILGEVSSSSPLKTATHTTTPTTPSTSAPESIEFGLMVWSTGLKQIPLIDGLGKEIGCAKNGRLFLDSHLRVLSSTSSSLSPSSPSPSSSSSSPFSDPHFPLHPICEGRVFAMGDCAADYIKPLPPLAQVASQQAIYLAKMFNKQGLESFLTTPSSTPSSPSSSSSSFPTPPPFKYQHLGSMASVGDWKGVVDTTGISMSVPLTGLGGGERMEMGMGGHGSLKGLSAFFLWRAAYWTKQVSIQNKILIVMYWFKSMLFGRDISKF